MTSQLPIGALVELSSQPGSYGVLEEVDDDLATVRWDSGVGPDPVEVDALQRVELSSMVERIGSQEAGQILNLASNEPPRWRVLFTSGEKTVPEAALRPRQSLDPVEKFKNGEIGSCEKFRLAVVTRHHQLAYLHDDLISLGQSRLDIKPHQVGVAHRVVTNYPHRFLLCDEVGLGKTIEAGMILKELRTRGIIKRCLIIVPANLRKQWQFELKTKFNEAFTILDAPAVRHLQDVEAFQGNPFQLYDNVIVSKTWLTHRKKAKKNEPDESLEDPMLEEEYSVLEDPIQAHQVRQVDWDMVIVDEAHHARYGTLLYRLVRDLVEPDHFGKRASLFITATPMQLHTSELYNLIELLDPLLFPSVEHFERHQRKTLGLSRLVEELTFTSDPVPEEVSDSTLQQIKHWLDIPEEEIHRRLTQSGEERKKVCEELKDQHLLSEILIRNRKKVVGGFMPRKASRWGVTLTNKEHEAIRQVEEYVQEGFERAKLDDKTPYGFIMVLFQKMMASSIQALKSSLEKRQKKLLKEADKLEKTKHLSTTELEQLYEEQEDAIEIEEAIEIAALHKEEASDLNDLLQILQALPVDSKGDEFIRQMKILFEEDPKAKVLVFTQFIATQIYIKKRLEEINSINHPIGVSLFSGQMESHSKDDAVERFRDSSGPHILVSTEAGGEGRNFQFCHYLVNYDLPWNPMRVEQRIGRLDRIGQDHSVHIFNLYSENTVEEQVLEVLEARIDAFENTVGGLDPILGDFESDLREILRRAPAEHDAAFEELGQRIENQIHEFRQANEQLRDFIMDTKSYSHEIADKIAEQDHGLPPEEQEAFMLALLTDIHTEVKKGKRTEDYELTFNEPFLHEHYQDFFATGSKRVAVLRPDVLRDIDNIEFFAFGHPIVDSIVEDVLSMKYEGVTGSWRITTTDLPACSGWLFIHLLETLGIRPRQDLVPVFVDDDGTINSDLGAALVQYSTRFTSETKEANLSSENIPTDDLDKAAELASPYVNRLASEYEELAATEAERNINQEQRKLEAWFQHRENVAQDKLYATRVILQIIRERITETQDDNARDNDRRILPVWEKNLENAQTMLNGLPLERRRRVAELEQHRYPNVDQQLVAVARIEICSSDKATDSTDN